MQTMNPYWMIFITAFVALVPIALGLVTSYVKVSVVLSMVRNALGTQQVPGTLVIMALSFALTCFIMGPVVERSFENAKGVKLASLVNTQPNLELLNQAAGIFEPWREFLHRHSGARELGALQSLDAERATADRAVDAAKPEPAKAPTGAEQPALRVLLPAFVLSELKEAFMMGFLVLLPFLVIDLIVANILAGMGMFMMSPTMISLPIKLLVFVLSDAWLIIIRGLVLSYR